MEIIATNEQTVRQLSPLLHPPTGQIPTKASQLTIIPCPINHARQLNEIWHSRLPVTQRGPWTKAFAATFDGITYGVALWNNPSARTLPRNWEELRRLAIAPDAPHCTASRMLAEMAKWYKQNKKEIVRLISYQDLDVHKGTIYKAAGWEIGYISKARTRDRSTTRPNGKMYRTNTNGQIVDSAPKARWELKIQ